MNPDGALCLPNDCLMILTPLSLLLYSLWLPYGFRMVPDESLVITGWIPDVLMDSVWFLMGAL